LVFAFEYFVLTLVDMVFVGILKIL
jgi:hypothetical protein